MGMYRRFAVGVGIAVLALPLLHLFGWHLGGAKPPKPAAARQPVDVYWQRAQREVYRSTVDLLEQDRNESRQGIRYRKLMRGDPSARVVALTFDDGPHPNYTPKLLAILDKYHVKATFFVVGKMAERYPNLIRAENSAGDLVANHTYHHLNLTKIPEDQANVEWRACSDVIESIIHKAPRFCRPPGGDYNANVINAASGSGMTTVLWTDDPGDYASPGDKTIETRVLGRMDNGAIILLHDGVQETVDVLPKIIESLQRRGFSFETVDKMVTGPGAEVDRSAGGART